mmetsp:Transcript_33991/g.82220  ORF Transcript_33991/g.82220 Transcript_33991/m.82220 type:complete len:205 (-) Transcript_33991:372-986(-)
MRPSSIDRLADISSRIAATISKPDRCSMCAAKEAITLPKIPPSVPPNPTNPRRFNRKDDLDGGFPADDDGDDDTPLLADDRPVFPVTTNPLSAEEPPRAAAPSLSSFAALLSSAVSSYSIASVVTPHINESECNFMRCTTKKNMMYMTFPLLFTTQAKARKNSAGKDSSMYRSSAARTELEETTYANCCCCCCIPSTSRRRPSR